MGLIREGKAIKYHGATGPLEFDANGDVTGPALVWKITNGEILVDYTISIEEMQALFKKVEGCATRGRPSPIDRKAVDG